MQDGVRGGGLDEMLSGREAGSGGGVMAPSSGGWRGAGRDFGHGLGGAGGIPAISEDAEVTPREMARQTRMGSAYGWDGVGTAPGTPPSSRQMRKSVSASGVSFNGGGTPQYKP